jgi:ATP-dependent RNA helicase DDX49/DBP8
VLGAPLNIRTAVIVGGMDMIAQALELENRPHVVVATPGRIVDHLKSSRGEWDLSRIKFLASAQRIQQSKSKSPLTRRRPTIFI